MILETKNSCEYCFLKNQILRREFLTEISFLNFCRNQPTYQSSAYLVQSHMQLTKSSDK